jgi:hypothetical protein
MALYFLMLFTPVPVDAAGLPAHLADLCPTARRIAEQPPCLRAEECGAFEQWRQTFGEPGMQPLEPRSALIVPQATPQRLCLVSRATVLSGRR